ncbi:MAG: hypothetical protein OQK98_00490 [Gammaproteobacteria bacterium]|nr:hypothetical protein [Gammaproteobacteria bacterium]
MKASIKIILFICAFYTSKSVAIDPRLDWRTVESDHFYIHYAEGYERLAQKTANSAEQAHKKLQSKINWQPADKTHLVISDETDSANGYATPIHFNRSVLFMAPPDSANSLEDFNDWLETLIIHEYTHVLHLDKVSGGAESLRKIFGRQFLFFPNLYQPNWFTEGLATYLETDNEKGIGRGQSSLFKMMMRSEVENGIKPANQVNLPIRSWPMGTVAYLYGVHFYQFLEETYGQQAITGLIENYSNNIVPFMINTNTEQLFNKDIDELWVDFSVWLTKRYQPEIDKQKSAGVVEGEKITDSGYNTGSVDLLNDEIYYVTSGAFEHTKLIKKKSEQSEFISELHLGAKINVHEKGILVIQREFCDEYNINSDIYIIENNKIKRVTKCGRYRSASWSPDGQYIAAVKTDKAKSELNLLDVNGLLIKNIWKGNNTDIVSQLRWSPSGENIVAAVFRTGHGWNIEEFNLNSLQWNAITNDQYIDMYPSYDEQGDAILFSSDRTGRYQIYRYVKDSEQLEQITRVASGAFEPVQANKYKPLYYVGYNVNGRDIYQLNKTDVLTTMPIVHATDIDIDLAADVEISQPKKYSAFSSLYARWWLPYISLNEDRNEYGITTSGNDALGIHNYFVNFAYDTNNEWLIGNVSYSYANRFAFGYQRSTDIVRDNNGEFALARNVDDVFFSVGFNDPAIESSIQYRLGFVVSESTDGNRAIGIPELADTQDNLFAGAVIFDNTQSYIRSISQSDGRNIRLLAESSEVLESDFSGEVYNLDWREYINLGKQHVLALRLVQGWGTQQPKPFRLGGEGSEFELQNFIEPISESLFARRRYALRGYAEGYSQLSGRRMQLASLEWRFPGQLIERGFMSPPAGLIQWSASVFAETGDAYDGSSVDEYYSSVGFELQADVNLFYAVTTRMRLGIASGLNEVIGEERVYFDLGASF